MLVRCGVLLHFVNETSDIVPDSAVGSVFNVHEQIQQNNNFPLWKFIFLVSLSPRFVMFFFMCYLMDYTMMTCDIK